MYKAAPVISTPPRLSIHEFVQPIFECICGIGTSNMAAQFVPRINHSIGKPVSDRVFVESENLSNLKPLRYVSYTRLFYNQNLIELPFIEPRIPFVHFDQEGRVLKKEKIMSRVG